MRFERSNLRALGCDEVLPSKRPGRCMFGSLTCFPTGGNRRKKAQLGKFCLSHFRLCVFAHMRLFATIFFAATLLLGAGCHPTPRTTSAGLRAQHPDWPLTVDAAVTKILAETSEADKERFRAGRSFDDDYRGGMAEVADKMTTPNKIGRANRRPTLEFDARREFESTSCAPASLSRAVAHRFR